MVDILERGNAGREEERRGEGFVLAGHCASAASKCSMQGLQKLKGRVALATGGMHSDSG